MLFFFCSMKIELLIFGFLPVGIAILTLVWTILLSIKSQSVLQWVVSFIVAGLTGWSLLMLHAIFMRGAWPTYWPHICILAALFVTVGQAMVIWFAGRSRRD